MENPRDAALLEQPQLALEAVSGLIVIDEIQRATDLFPLLRYLVDTHRDQRYLILDSASRASLILWFVKAFRSPHPGPLPEGEGTKSLS